MPLSARWAHVAARRAEEEASSGAALVREPLVLRTENRSTALGSFTAFFTGSKPRPVSADKHKRALRVCH